MTFVLAGVAVAIGVLTVLWALAAIVIESAEMARQQDLLDKEHDREARQ